MKSITYALEEVANSPPITDEVEIYVLINDSELDEPRVSRTILPEQELARSSGRGIVEDMMEAKLVESIKRWRAEYNE